MKGQVIHDAALGSTLYRLKRSNWCRAVFTHAWFCAQSVQTLVILKALRIIRQKHRPSP